VKLIAALTIVLGWLTLDGVLLLQPIFKSGVEMVRVDALVVRDEKPVADLKAEDFEVFDNGARQTIDHVLSAEDPIDVMLTLDTSASLDKAELKHLADGVRSAVADLKPGDRAGLITFSEELSQLLPLTGRLDLLPASLNRLESSGATTLIDAAYAALLSTRARGRRSLVLLFTDGLDTWSWLEPEWVLAVAKRSETVIYTVELREAVAPFVRIPGVRGRIEPRDYYRAATRFLDDIVETTGGRRLDAGDFDRLQATLKSVIGEFRQRYVIAYAPQGVTQDGWHTLDVRVKRRGVTVRARPGYSR
jgi:Ca-activated chloride channel family protein